MKTEYGDFQLPGYNKFVADQLEIIIVESDGMIFTIFLVDDKKEVVASIGVK